MLNGHSCGLFKHGENYYYYDPNDKFGEYRSKSIEGIAKHIFKVFESMREQILGVNIGKIAFSVNVYDFGKEYQEDGLMSDLFSNFRHVPAYIIDDMSIILKKLMKGVNNRLGHAA